MTLRDHPAEGQTEMGRNGTQGARRDVGCIVSRVTQGHKLGYVLARYLLGFRETNPWVNCICKGKNKTYIKAGKERKGKTIDTLKMPKWVFILLEWTIDKLSASKMGSWGVLPSGSWDGLSKKHF